MSNDKKQGLQALHLPKIQLNLKITVINNLLHEKLRIDFTCVFKLFTIQKSFEKTREITPKIFTVFHCPITSINSLLRARWQFIKRESL